MKRRLLLGMVLVWVVQWGGWAQSAHAQQVFGTGIRFQPQVFRPITFNGFSFQTQSFRLATNQSIQFQSITFPGFDSPAFSRVSAERLNTFQPDLLAGLSPGRGQRRKVLDPLPWTRGSFADEPARTSRKRIALSGNGRNLRIASETRNGDRTTRLRRLASRHAEKTASFPDYRRAPQNSHASYFSQANWSTGSSLDGEWKRTIHNPEPRPASTRLAHRFAHRLAEQTGTAQRPQPRRQSLATIAREPFLAGTTSRR